MAGQASGARERLQIDVHNTMARNQSRVRPSERAHIKVLPQIAHAVRAHIGAAVALVATNARTGARTDRVEILERQRDVGRTGRAVKQERCEGRQACRAWRGA